MADANRKATFKSLISPEYTGETMVYFGRKAGEEKTAEMLNFLNGDRKSLSDIHGHFLPLVGWVAKIADFNADGGVKRRGVLIGLICDDGAIVTSTSATIADTLDTFRELIGEPPYTKPIWVRIDQITTRNKRKTDQLTYIPVTQMPKDGMVWTEKGSVVYAPTKK